MSGVAGTHMFKHTRATIVVSQTTNVFHFAGIRPIDMYPGVLYGVVSFGERAEHSTGHSPQGGRCSSNRSARHGTLYSFSSHSGE
jgi:hypothetical protein